MFPRPWLDNKFHDPVFLRMREVAACGRRVGLVFPVLFDTKSEVSKLYKVETMPTTVIVAKDGTMRYLHHGYKDGYENDYQTEVRTLLRE